MIDESLESFVGKSIFICKIKIIKNLVEPWAVGVREFFKNIVEFLPDIFRLFRDNKPAAIFRNLKAVIILCVRNLFIFILFYHFFILLIPHIADTLVKKKAKYIFFIIRAVNLSPKNVCTSPKKRLKLWEG